MDHHHIESEAVALICLSGRESYTSDFAAKDMLYVKMKSSAQPAKVVKADLESALAVKDVLAAVSVLDLPGVSGETLFAPMAELAAAAGETELAVAKGCMKIALELESCQAEDNAKATDGPAHGGVEPYTVIATAQGSRLVISTSTIYTAECCSWVAKALGVREENVEILSPSVGGFEGKAQHYCREALCALLAMRTGRPVRYELTRKLAWEAVGGRYDLY